MTPSNLPTGLLVSSYKGRYFYEAKWSHAGRQVKRRIGPAHVVPDGDGGWKRKRGRAPEGYFDQKMAELRRAELIREHALEQGVKRGKRDATFGDAATAFLDYEAHTVRAKPSTLNDYRLMLAQPGEQKKRGAGEKKARIMRELGDKRLRSIETEHISKFLSGLDKEGLSARNVNKHRAVLHALFEYCRKPDAYGLTENPVKATDKRRERDRQDIHPFTPEELAAIVRAAEKGEHRVTPDKKYGDATRAEWERFNRQDAALFIVAAETGLRQGELRALRWRDVDFMARTITVAQAISNGEVDAPKSGKKRSVPLPDRAAQRIAELSHRERFTSKNDRVFCGGDGGILDRRSITRRFKVAQVKAGIEARGFHHLRHTYLSQLVAEGIDTRTVQELAGHSSITTTERYLHYRPQRNLADRISAAFAPESPDVKAASPSPATTHSP